MLLAEEKDFSLDHIILMAISELEETCEEIPKICLDNRFQNYNIRLNDLQVGDMIYAIQSQIKPLLRESYSRINLVAIVDKDNPNTVDLGVTVNQGIKPNLAAERFLRAS